MTNEPDNATRPDDLQELAKHLVHCFGSGAKAVALWRADHARHFMDLEWSAKWNAVAQLC